MAIQTSIENGLGRLVLSNPPVNILTRELMASLREELALLCLKHRNGAAQTQVKVRYEREISRFSEWGEGQQRHAL